MARAKSLLTLIALWLITCLPLSAQLSPGPLSQVHAHLEGLSNCTKCHDLGNKVTNEKCLDCHSLLKNRIDQKKGYHYSREVKGKQCVECHNDHHGRNFQIVRFDKENFDHELTGYILKGAHTEQECIDCHKTGFIVSQEIREKEFTYLGLSTNCQACHDDFHQGTLSENCEDCHGFNSFKPAEGFSHIETRFPLKGKHKTVDCKDCHKIGTRNGKAFQEFSGLKFSSCSDCHKDVHNNKFGQNCKDCHTEASFHIIQGIENFDHNRTRFALEGKHQNVECKSCHKGKLTDPIAFARCSDCHKDYHKGDFKKENSSPDCSECHTVKGFQPSTFTIEKHQQTSFKLEGAHLATPCFACHKKPERWTFKDIGQQCSDCHNDIHAPYLDAKYYPGKSCKECHKVEAWTAVSFDHKKTAFPLEGKHQEQSCRDCHTLKDQGGEAFQKFTGLGTLCTTCHDDVHFSQFEVEGKVDCARCHGFQNWEASKFDHNKTRFPLKGRHKEIGCDRCHKKVKVIEGEKEYVQYKMEDIRCAACH